MTEPANPPRRALLDCGDPALVHRLAGELGRGRVDVVARAADVGAEAVEVYLPWIGRPYSVAPLRAALALRSKHRTLLWIDELGHAGYLTATLWCVESLRWAWLQLWSLVASTLAALLRIGARPAHAAHAAPAAECSGPIAIIVPVLPDVSHTFVYREVWRLLQHEPGLAVIALEAGDPGVVHPEAERLLDVARFVGRHGITAHYREVIAWLLRHPRRARRMLAAYPRARDLFGKLPLRNPRHPGRAFALATRLSHLPPGPIHVYGSTWAANVALGAATLLDRPVSISSYVDFDFDYSFKMLREKLAQARFFRVCTHYCAARVQELVPGVDPRRLPMIVWGLDLADFPALDPGAPGPGPGAARRDAPPLLLSACRLVPKKGLHFVPPALAALRSRGIDARWLVAGDGPERARLERLVAEHGVADRVEFLGAVPNDVVRRHLRRATAAVLPCVVASDGERDGIPVFLTEAMALGAVVVSTPVSGIPELVHDGVDGCLVPPGDPRALANALARVLADAALRGTLAQNAHRHVRRTQDADRSAAELLALLRAPDSGA